MSAPAFVRRWGPGASGLPKLTKPTTPEGGTGEAAPPKLTKAPEAPRFVSSVSAPPGGRAEIEALGPRPEEPGEAQAAWDALAAHGWVALHSDVLDLDVVWVRDDGVAVPAPWVTLPRYTWAEVADLVRVGVDGEQLRRVHAVRSMFGGRVVVEPVTEAPPPPRKWWPT